jgi:hypothetical protein
MRKQFEKACVVLTIPSPSGQLSRNILILRMWDGVIRRGHCQRQEYWKMTHQLLRVYAPDDWVQAQMRAEETRLVSGSNHFSRH